VITMRGASTEIRQQLRNQSLNDLLTSSINTVGGRIFPDDLAVIDMDAFNQIIKAWQQTHVATYGQVLPNTGVVATGIASGSGIEPGDNEVIEVIGVEVANAGGAPIEFQVKIGDLVLFGGAAPPNGITTSQEIGVFPLTLSKGNALKFGVTSGTTSDFSAKVAYNFRSQ